MKQGGGKLQRGPLYRRGLQRLGPSSDLAAQWLSDWEGPSADSLASRREKRLRQADPLGVGPATQGALPIGPCKFAFYLLFYMGVIGLYTICTVFFFATLSNTEPKYTLDESLVGSSPGLGFRPMMDLDSILITYRLGDAAAIGRLTKKLDAFLIPYSDVAQQKIYYHDCDFDRPAPAGEVCKVTISNWSLCTSEEGYGFAAGSPCVFIKLNRIYDWVPVYYNRTSDLPKAMPKALRKHIQSVGNKKMRNVVWVSCVGINATDAHNIGPVSYVPDRGFPGYYYPYRNQRGYLSPLVAVRFEKPKHGVTIKVECKAWAKNIVHNRDEVMGLAHFQIKIQ